MAQKELKELINLIELAKLKVEEPEKYEQLMAAMEDVLVRLSEIMKKFMIMKRFM